MVKPAAQLDRLDEVLVITSTEPRFSAQEQQDLATSETLKGAEAAAIQEQQKASQIMAERLPGLIEPNVPPEQQPLLDTSNPNPVAHPPQALHPDRFTPGTTPDTQTDPNAGATPDASSENPPSAPEGQPGKPALKPRPKSGQTAKPPQTEPRRNP
jgi:rod shape-determining protein MreC